MQFNIIQVAAPIAAIVLLIVLILKLKLHPFLALMVSAGFLGLISGLTPAATVQTFQKGFGGILSSTGLVVGLGSMLGGLLLDSGGADRIATTFTNLGSAKWIPTSICAAALLIGLPHLFDVSFVMLAPLTYAIAKRTGSQVLRVGIPMAAGLYVSHGLLPPHPSPTLAMAVYHADAGYTILYGLIIAIPMAIISGPLFTSAVMRLFFANGAGGNPFDAPLRDAPRPTGAAPPLGLVLLTILLPPGLMLLRTLGRNYLPAGGTPLQILDGIGDPIASLLIAVLFAVWSLGLRSGLNLQQLQKLLGRSLAPAAGVILIIGAGGGLKEMLVATHIGDLIAHGATQWQVNPLLLAWAVAALIRIAVGSATVATVTAAGIVAPLAAVHPEVNTALLVLATSTGSLMLSHVNDSGFWLFKEYFQLSVPETLKSWTLLVSVQSLIGLAGVMLLSALVG